MVIYNRRRGIYMDFVEVNEHIAEWCDVNGYRIVESHKLKNRQIEIVDIRYGLLLRYLHGYRERFGFAAKGAKRYR